MKVYIAGAFERRSELARAARSLIRHHGHEITSRWLFAENTIGNVPSGDDGRDTPAAAAERRAFALHDLEDIDAADVLVAFTEPPGTPYSRGGRHVELGYAIAKGKQVVVVGHRENIFCWLPGIVFCRYVADLPAVLETLE